MVVEILYNWLHKVMENISMLSNSKRVFTAQKLKDGGDQSITMSVSSDPELFFLTLVACGWSIIVINFLNIKIY